MVDVLTIPPTGGSRADVRRIAEVLASGGIAAVPSETGYFLCSSPLSPGPVETLLGLAPPGRFALCLLDAAAAEDVVAPESWTPAAERLMRRCWPGPLTLEFPYRNAPGLWDQWPPVLRSRLAAEGWVRLCCSGHPLLREVGAELPWPLLAAPATQSAPDRRFESIADVRERAAGVVQLLVDAGPPRYQDRATTVRITSDRCELVEEGIVGARTVTQLSSQIILFVCTGNTCRSPMAEALFRKMLADRLHCDDEELPSRGYLVLSAGLATTPGMPASEQAVDLLREAGMDLTGHQSQAATAELLNVADHVITMTRSHRESIGARYPEILHRVRLLSPAGKDVSDPFGGGRDEYVRCRDEIQTYLVSLLDQLAPKSA